jgi:MoxR-like ATPase
MVAMVSNVHNEPSLRSYLIDIAEATRQHPSIQLGMSPRATLSLQRVARAKAAASGRNFVTDDDIKAVASDVVSHRLILNSDSLLRGISSEDLIQDILGAVPVPHDRS